jgi:hypothetical protein
MPEKTPEEIRAYEETHGLGAAWGDEESLAVVRVFDPDGARLGWSPGRFPAHRHGSARRSRH